MEVDYSKLSRRELEDVASHLDRRAFPERATVVDAELRRRPPSKDVPSSRTRDDANAWFMAGTIVALIGFVPLVVGLLLSAVGVAEIGTGLGLGLLFFFCGGIAAALFSVGEWRSRRHRVPPN